ncbi:MAG: hypothetical protein JNM25_18090 [Planctomycetes bacterium]|nr:hypothetical protein [Planctomycetota bacterium]
MRADARSPVGGLLADVRRSALAWGTAMLAAGAAVWWLASAARVQPFVAGTVWLLVGLVVMPLLFTVGLGAITLVLTVLLTALSLPWLLRGRPTGLGPVLAEAWQLAGAVLPGYWRALRRVRRPALWGGVLGFCAGTATFVLVHGLRPPGA